MKPMIIFVTFETEYSSYGGLGAVMKLLPKEMGEKQCAILSPLFKKWTNLEQLNREKKAKKVSSLFTFYVLVRGHAYPVEVIEVVNPNGLKIYFLSSDEFFNTPENPYVNPCNPNSPLDPYRNPINGEKLAEDSLFFSIAVPIALTELCKEGFIKAKDVILHLQDWETAAVAQAVKRTHTHPALHSIRCFLTIHNPYDKPLHQLNSPRVLDFSAHLGFEIYQSVLAQVIPLLDGPVSTVSANFAHELRNEVLYTQTFCPHLQKAFKRKGLVGVDNGIFGAPTFPFSETAFQKAQSGDFSAIQSEKWAQRIQLATVMRDYQQKLTEDGKTITWGSELDLSEPNVPIFFILGRDDPRQKGFDVIVEAIHSLPRGAGRYIFTVMPGDEGLLGLKFMQHLANERPGEVCVFPFRLEKAVFGALQQGSSYLVMGSLYEPFGAANEGYLAGMPVVARATGGLVQQIAPHSDCMEDEEILSLYGRQLVRQYHAAHDAPTGILFREQVSFADEVEGWRDIVDCGYWEQNPKGDRIGQRKEIFLFQEMHKSAAAALRLAINLYQDQPQYAEMIFNGWNMLPKFTWGRAIEAYYRQVYHL
ncbi:glycogen synthase 1 [Candidatus Moduliflexus flocculans]|uniref:starch synthase n=1 Tax=Candidatus Moduliflexus flocculans TaxID=1499966 RepID=A0A081BLJ7_9BACT|nr:glycogen synthase 1 [Candidatus Moduliflexus flocculans]